ncbi:hypothetical protein K438DRAFT_1763132 [Mycena galopus ATCC 62051]|nr:hypothetical protein K438DRAFT_1763132 [Mycena galopus ATCC 62051]
MQGRSLSLGPLAFGGRSEIYAPVLTCSAPIIFLISLLPLRSLPFFLVNHRLTLTPHPAPLDGPDPQQDLLRSLNPRTVDASTKLSRMLSATATTDPGASAATTTEHEDVGVTEPVPDDSALLAAALADNALRDISVFPTDDADAEDVVYPRSTLRDPADGELQDAEVAGGISSVGGMDEERTNEESDEAGVWNGQDERLKCYTPVTPAIEISLGFGHLVSSSFFFTHRES